MLAILSLRKHHRHYQMDSVNKPELHSSFKKFRDELIVQSFDETIFERDGKLIFQTGSEAILKKMIIISLQVMKNYYFLSLPLAVQILTLIIPI